LDFTACSNFWFKYFHSNCRGICWRKFGCSCDAKTNSVERKNSFWDIIALPRSTIIFSASKSQCSTFYSLEDFILPPNFLAACVNAYLFEKYENGTDLFGLSKHKTSKYAY
jgi:hypothetical protein